MYSIVRVTLLACAWALQVKAQGSFIVTSPPAGIILYVGQSVRISWDFVGIPANYTTAKLGWRTGSRNAPIIAPGTSDVMGIDPHSGTYTTTVPELVAGTYYYCVDANGTQWGISQGFTIEDASSAPVSSTPVSSTPISSSYNSSSSPSSSSLSPSSTSLGHSSASIATISNSNSLSSSSGASTNTLTLPTQTPSPTPNPSPSNLVPIVGGVIAAVAVGIMAFGLIFYKRRYKYRAESQTRTTSLSENVSNRSDMPMASAPYDSEIVFANRPATSINIRPVATAQIRSQIHYGGNRHNYEPKNSAVMTLKPDEW